MIGFQSFRISLHNKRKTHLVKNIKIYSSIIKNKFFIWSIINVLLILNKKNKLVYNLNRIDQ